MAETPCNLGFEGRVFLTEVEWQTYRRRKPVRYIRRKHKKVCAICGKKARIPQEFQHAHIIGFDMGIIDLGLTPTFLDAGENIVTAHRGKCNATAELSLDAAMQHLMKFQGIVNLPRYLPETIQRHWEKLQKEEED
jgi:hypothetical protein